MKQTTMNKALGSAKRNYQLILSMLAALALSACVSVPQQIQFPNEAQGSDLLLRQAIQKPDAYQGQQVRWGGLIAKVENAEQNTRVEIVGQLLDSRGRPRLSEQSEGRFVAIISGFIDPLIYKEGRELTVIGTTTEPITDKIGEHNYTFPVVQSQATTCGKSALNIVTFPCRITLTGVLVTGVTGTGLTIITTVVSIAIATAGRLAFTAAATTDTHAIMVVVVTTTTGVAIMAVIAMVAAARHPQHGNPPYVNLMHELRKIWKIAAVAHAVSGDTGKLVAPV